MKMKTMLKIMSYWPPYLGAGVRVCDIAHDLTSVEVEMKLKFWNKNINGTQFGGSLYSMIDPFLALILIHHLGKEHVVWDKTATIHFKKPADGKVYAKIALEKEQIESIRQQAQNGEKVEPKFHIKIHDHANNIVAEVEKILYVRKKKLP